MGPRPEEVDHLWSADRELQNAAYTAVMAATNQPVTWAYEIWDEAVANLRHKDNHNRAIAAQLLCNLAKSDPERRILGDFDQLLEVSRDKRFVTARHCLQSLWKVGVVGPSQQGILMDGLEVRFRESTVEKNSTLIRYDIIESMRKIYDATHDDAIKSKALELTATEENVPYRKKYASLWKDQAEAKDVGAG